MRAAPPVSVRCSGGRAWRAVQALLSALAALACAAWLCRLAGWPPGGALVAAAVAGLLGWRFDATPARALAWDGQRWAADGVAGSLDVMLDLPGWLLLRLRPAGAPHARARWLALTQADAGPAWHALRVAAYAHAGTAPDGAPGAEQARG